MYINLTKNNLNKLKPSKSVFYAIKMREIFNVTKFISYFEFSYVLKMKRRVIEL